MTTPEKESTIDIALRAETRSIFLERAPFCCAITRGRDLLPLYARPKKHECDAQGPSATLHHDHTPDYEKGRGNEDEDNGESETLGEMIRWRQ